MNWLLMLLAAVAGGVATWLWSVRTVRRQVPVYEPKPARHAFVENDDVRAAAGRQDAGTGVDEATADADVLAAPPPVAEQGVLGGLEAAPATGTDEAAPAVEAAGTKRKPRRKKKHPASTVATEPEAMLTEPEGPYGPGSAASAEDGSGPEGWSIKGNANSGLYHAPESPWYGRTKAEAWFQTEQAAEAAGFTRWDRRTTK